MSEIKRKLFHLIGFLYVAGAWALPRKTFIMAMTILLMGEGLVEAARLRSPACRAFFLRNFGSLYREHEKNRFSGVFWMMLGVLTAGLLIESRNALACVLLFLVVGDTAASLAGKALGGPRWPGSEKRIGGSLACGAVCMGIGLGLLRPDYSLTEISSLALAATVFEYGFMKFNDNFLIPAGTAAVVFFLQ